jgi:glycosyltransferase involved in cell wall biosynthesis
MDTQTTRQNETETAEDIPIHVALLVDRDYLYRFRSIFAHMLVGLVDQPISVTLVCPDPSATASLPIGPAKIVEFKVPFWPWQYKNTLKNLAAELRNAKVNLIHSCSGKPCWLATELAKEMDLPYLVSFTGLFQEECYTRLDQKQCGKLIGVSQPICDTLHDLYGKANDKIELVRPGCFIRPQKPRTDHPKTILSIGQFTHNSGYDTLLRALAEVRNRGLECWTILLGQGPLENTLHRWVNKNNLNSMVSFIDLLPNWEEVLSEVDFYIQPGPFYTLHSGPYEAIAHSCPIIATQDTAFDLLIDGQTGRKFKTGDHIGLANLLCEWIDDKIDWQTMSNNAHTLAKNELSLAATTEKLVDCYRSVLTAARGAR